MEAQPPEIEQHKTDTEGLRRQEKRPGVSITGRDRGSLYKKSLGGRGSGPFSWSQGESGSFATSSSHFIENPPACS